MTIDSNESAGLCEAEHYLRSVPEGRLETVRSRRYDDGSAVSVFDEDRDHIPYTVAYATPPGPGSTEGAYRRTLTRGRWLR